MPGTPVSKFSFTEGPLVAGSMGTPASSLSSFSGSRPTDSSSVSQGISSSVPGIGRRFSSTWASTTPSTRRLPRMFTTVWLSFSGMPKSSRHCTMLRRSPLE